MCLPEQMVSHKGLGVVQRHTGGFKYRWRDHGIAREEEAERGCTGTAERQANPDAGDRTDETSWWEELGNI